MPFRVTPSWCWGLVSRTQYGRIRQKRTLLSTLNPMNPTDFIDAYLPLAQRLRDVTVPGQEPFPRPNSGATEQQLTEAERHLGVRLDEQHRRFLMHANGWPEFSGTFSLFGTGDLLGSTLMNKAREQLRIISGTAMGRFRWKRKRLLPIAVSDGTLGVWCMLMEQGQVQPSLIWFDNTEPDERETFNTHLTEHLSSLPTHIAHFSNPDWKRSPRAN